jgi:O-antigen/teichoic acid export membrane protein
MKAEISAVDSPGPAKPLTGVALRGMAWMTLVVISSKISGLLAQWGLGLLLMPREFGVFAVVTVAQNFVEGFRDIGASKILVQRGGEFDQLASPILKLSLAANMLAVFVLCAGAPTFAAFYSEPRLKWLLPFVAAAIPLSTLAMIYKAKANRDLNYKLIGQVEAGIALIQNVLTVFFAWCGLGVLSFVLPFALVALLQFVAYRYAVGPLAAGERLTKALFWELFQESKWLMLGAYGMGLVIRGDYLILGRTLPRKADLGIYYFGFQFAASMGVLLTTGIQNVMMPAFSTITADSARLLGAYLRSTRLLLWFSSVSTGLFVVTCAEVVRILWHGKWDAAVFTAEVIALSLPLKLLAPLGNSLLESRGMWRQRTLFLLGDGFLVVTCAYLGGVLDGVTGAAACIALQRCLVGFMQGVYSAHKIGASLPVAIWDIVGGTAGLAVGTVACAFFPLGFGGTSFFSLVLAGGAKAAIFVLVWAAVSALCAPAAWRDVWSLVSKRFRQRLPFLAAAKFEAGSAAVLTPAAFGADLPPPDKDS